MDEPYYNNRQWPTVASQVLDTQKSFDTRKECLETRNKAKQLLGEELFNSLRSPHQLSKSLRNVIRIGNGLIHAFEHSKSMNNS